MNDPQLVTLVESVGAPPPFHPKAKNFGDEHKAWVLAFLRELPSPQMAARAIGCSVDNLYEHRKRDPAFKAGMGLGDGGQLRHAARPGGRGGCGRRRPVTSSPARATSSPCRRTATTRYSQRSSTSGWVRGTSTRGLGDFDSGTMMIAVTPQQLDSLTRDERRELTRLLAKIESAHDGRPQTVNGSAQPVRALDRPGG